MKHYKVTPISHFSIICVNLYPLMVNKSVPLREMRDLELCGY